MATETAAPKWNLTEDIFSENSTDAFFSSDVPCAEKIGLTQKTEVITEKLVRMFNM